MMNMREISKGLYFNAEYAVSIKCPSGWRVVTELPPLPELLIHFAESGGGTINLVAGPVLIPNESIRELENLAIRNIHRIGGIMESLRHIQVDKIDAVEVVYEIPQGMKTKKVGLVREGIEYILTCSVGKKKYDKYLSIFDECIQSISFTGHNQEF